MFWQTFGKKLRPPKISFEALPSTFYRLFSKNAFGFLIWKHLIMSSLGKLQQKLKNLKNVFFKKWHQIPMRWFRVEISWENWFFGGSEFCIESLSNFSRLGAQKVDIFVPIFKDWTLKFLPNEKKQVFNFWNLIFSQKRGHGGFAVPKFVRMLLIFTLYDPPGSELCSALWISAVRHFWERDSFFLESGAKCTHTFRKYGLSSALFID